MPSQIVYQFHLQLDGTPTLQHYVIKSKELYEEKSSNAKGNSRGEKNSQQRSVGDCPESKN